MFTSTFGPISLFNTDIRPVAEPILFKDNVFTTTDVMLRLPKVQALHTVTFSDIALELDQDLSLIYGIDLAPTLAKVNIGDTTLAGDISLKTSGKVVKNDSDWTISSELASIEIATPDSNWASAERLLNTFNYRLSLSGTELVDISLTGQQRIVGLKTKSQDNAPLNAKQIDTDWQVASSRKKVWEIKLKNKIPELSSKQIKVSKLNNTSNITLAFDSSVKLTGQSEIQSITYTDKKLTNIALVHDVKTQPKMKLMGNHELQLGSGLKAQISHTEENFKIAIKEQAVNSLQKLISQFNHCTLYCSQVQNGFWKRHL